MTPRSLPIRTTTSFDHLHSTLRVELLVPPPAVHLCFTAKWLSLHVRSETGQNIPDTTPIAILPHASGFWVAVVTAPDQLAPECSCHAGPTLRRLQLQNELRFCNRLCASRDPTQSYQGDGDQCALNHGSALQAVSLYTTISTVKPERVFKLTRYPPPE